MLPKKGSSFPIGRVGLTEAEFAQVIASALKVEFGSARNGTKISPNGRALVSARPKTG